MTSVLITGGSGFIGINLADRLIASGAKVHIFDNLSRRNVVRNLTWLLRRHGANSAEVTIADTRDRAAVRKALRGVDQVFHFAAQVAVTSSIEDPRTDFEVNVMGTFNILEECRALSRPPSLLYTSTNKVYGALPRLRLMLEDERYRCADGVESGIDESTPLDFHSPYGCSKGAAEQYVMDYHRTFGLPTTVFRMSCIYGPHQFGTEDQGWVAHIIAQAIAGQPVTIYGDGCQVRDVLYVDDLIMQCSWHRRISKGLPAKLSTLEEAPKAHSAFSNSSTCCERAGRAPRPGIRTGVWVIRNTTSPIFANLST